MSQALVVNIEHHRSRERIKDLGEVFTPEKYVQQMLDLFDQKIWADEEVIFFEPSAGHGNIVLPILARRVEALTKKYKRGGADEPFLRALATALNTLWAIDISPLNIDYARSRIFSYVIHVIAAEGISIRTKKMKDFLSHVLCTLLWQIHENETLSALSDEKTAMASAAKTKMGADWIKKNSHKPLDFSNDWISYIRNCTQEKSAPLVHERAKRFLSSIFDDGSVTGFSEFAFAKGVLQSSDISNGKLARAA